MSQSVQNQDLISPKTLELLAQILCKQAILLREVENHQEALVHIPDFVVLNAFKRVDRGEKDYITTLDILLFLKENGVIVSEQECYLIVSTFDSNKDNKLSFIDFQMMITPYSYTYKASFKSTQKHYVYGAGPSGDRGRGSISYDVEYGVLRVLQKQIEAAREVEELKQELVTMHDWSGLHAFRVIDEYSV